MTNKLVYLSKALSMQFLLCVGVSASFMIQAHEGEEHNLVPEVAHDIVPDSKTHQKNKLNPDKSLVRESNRKLISIAKGDRVELKVKNVCDKIVENCNVKSLSIRNGPSEGILFPLDMDGNAFYQHAGTSNISDEIVFSSTASDGDDSHIFSIVIEVVNSVAKLTILSPAPNFKTANRYLTVSFKVSGNNYDHVHMSVNGTDHISVYGEVGSHTFKGLPSGENRINVSLAGKDHRQIIGSNQTIVFDIAP